jgi:two-component system, CAI-1 autoinducer sensor kinase/phosphatase CqsS
MSKNVTLDTHGLATRPTAASRVKAKLLRPAPGRWAFAPLEVILHPSPWRLRLLGLTAILGQPLFGWVWSSWFVQPYENVWLRGLMSVLAGAFILPATNRHFSNQTTRVLIALVLWIELPFFFSWMYLCNNGNAVWLATVCAMIAFYYHLTDWRIATVGVFSGGLLAWALFLWTLPDTAYVSATGNAVNAVVIIFSWSCALLLGLSAANLRRAHLADTLATMGIMAHELRTPLATAALIGDAIQLEVQRQPAHPRAMKLEQLGQRLHTLARNMNRQIDTQIANARLLQLPRQAEQVSAATLVKEVVASYPYASGRQQACVQVTVHEDFVFCASASQFSQVLDNLIKNALHSLMAADSPLQPGTLRIDIDRLQAQGRILVADDGTGIAPALLPQIFKPFFSSNRNTGHGLGLAFCKQVVHSAGGSIQVKSQAAAGAVFIITMPVAAG